jgi:mRNA-degrading endonuclease toxin of MazEF toxin-antitoxin module
MLSGDAMFKEHDRIVLTNDVLDEGLMVGDVGTIVHVFRNAEAFEVEFVALDGNTAAIATVTASQIRSVTKFDITHARQMRASV